MKKRAALMCTLIVLTCLVCIAPATSAYAEQLHVAAQATEGGITAGEAADAVHEPEQKVRIAEGAYQLSSKLKSTFVLNQGKTAKSGAQLVLKKKGKSVFYIRPEGQDRYSIQLVAKGLFLTEESGKAVFRAWSGADKQLWWAASASGVTFVNSASGNALAVNSGKAKNGAKLVTKPLANMKAQRWKLVSKKLVPNGWYRIRSVLGTYLNVTGKGYANGTSLDAHSKTKNGTQCFQVKAIGSSYRIENARSFKSVAVLGGSKKNGADVVQQTSSKSSARLWKARLDHDGRYVFTNAKSGKALSIASNSKKSGANVVQRSVDGSEGQSWKLAKMSRYSLSGNSALDRGLAKILASHGTLKSAYEYVRDKFRWSDPDTAYRSGKYMSKANTKRYAKEMIKNKKGSCYCSSSLFMWLARGLGYKANVTVGYLKSNTPGLVGAHSWVEVRKGGKTYVCDPDCGRAYPSRDWYMKTYAKTPAEYHFW